MSKCLYGRPNVMGLSFKWIKWTKGPGVHQPCKPSSSPPAGRPPGFSWNAASKGAGSFQPWALFKGNFIFVVDMVLLLNLIRYSLGLHPRPVSLKWSDWSVMWNHTGFPSPIPAEDQESPAPCQNVSNAHWPTCFLTGMQHFQSVTSQSANTPNGWPHSGKSRVGDSGLYPSPAWLSGVGSFLCTRQTSTVVWSFSDHKDAGVKSGSCP